jgi:hypothetical protein
MIHLGQLRDRHDIIVAIFTETPFLSQQQSGKRAAMGVVAVATPVLDRVVDMRGVVDAPGDLLVAGTTKR